MIANDQRVTITEIGGMCPMQAEGTIDGAPFYFRVRWGKWEIGIDPDGDPVDVTISHGGPGRMMAGGMLGKEGFYRCGIVGDGEYTGYVENDEALRLIMQAATEYRDNQE